jgi:hypothetical protein
VSQFNRKPKYSKKTQEKSENLSEAHEKNKTDKKRKFERLQTKYENKRAKLEVEGENKLFRKKLKF